MIYSTGGAGINVGSFFTKFREENPAAGFAEMQAVYIDTSMSNIWNRPEIKSEDVYLLEDMDGSGKVRAENYREISERINDMLLKFPPADLNIVLSSTSGGSGSVIAPSLASELLKRERNVVVAAIASTDSRIEIENSVKTLKSYEAISQLREQPVVMLYYENNKENQRTEVNTSVRNDIVKLAALFSRQNKELDSADLRNWLNYSKVTKAEPRLVLLDFANGPVESARSQILTVATLAYEGTNTNIGSAVDYQCVGYIAEENKNSIQLTGPNHYLIVDGRIIDVYSHLANELGRIDELNAAKKRTVKSIVDGNDKVQNDGLVI